MPISSEKFERLSDPDQAELDNLAYRAVKLLREHPNDAFTALEITAVLLGRKPGFDIVVAIKAVTVEKALEMLVDKGHVEKKCDGPFGTDYFRMR